MMKKSFGFTLGEILIALGVIGIVASLVIPQLVNGHKATTARTQFDTAYSMLSKAIVEMEADDVPVEPSKYSSSGSFYDKFKEYNKITIDCRKYASTNTSVCLSTTSRADDKSYKNYIGQDLSEGNEKNLLDDGAFVLNNGMLVMLENPNDNPNGLLISVDINGKNKNPNMWGYDLFTFELVKGGQLLPVGAPGTGIKSNGTIRNWSDPTSYGRYCKKESGAGTYNGITCSFYAATDQDYFKKLYQGH